MAEQVMAEGSAYQGEVLGVSAIPFGETFTSKFEAASNQTYVSATTSIDTAGDTFEFEAKQVDRVEDTSEAGRLNIIFKDVVHGKYNNEIAITAATVSLGALTASILKMKYVNNEKPTAQVTLETKQQSKYRIAFNLNIRNALMVARSKDLLKIRRAPGRGV